MSNFMIGSASTATDVHTDELAHAIYAEEIAVMQRFRNQQIQPESKGTYPFTNPRWIDTRIGHSNGRDVRIIPAYNTDNLLALLR